MAKIVLSKLKCIKTSSGGGADDVYAKFFVDGQQTQKWPISGDYDMRVGDEAFINQTFSFNKDLKVELWEYDSTSADDYMGTHVFSATGSGSGKITLADPKEGNVYELGYEYLTTKIKVARLHSAKCVAMSESVNSDLVSKAVSLSSDVAAAAAKVLGQTPNPKAQLVGQALEAGATVLKGIPGLVDAIGKAGNYPDELYMTFTNQPGIAKRFWPQPGKYYEIYAGQIVRFDELRYPLTQSLDVSLWEYDSVSGDDQLGSFAIDKETEIGTYVKTVTSASEASIYLVAYTVAEEQW
ncbi:MULTISPECIES: C2 domain-containing protein [Calothrix]|uniref:C2 domain-containing protein n=2 Tax=Calothrix TaxID=1186 RepID=A0ABR8AI85_9CYAN|nr:MULTISPECIES: C2 domain-containing protein [Calothrix]MBD2199636.1 hypothetical protein [Calothrix parietina FACHB-288]MBD2228457.1 hypothetical protein [Calothrix anomala FACHB-343]